APGEQIYSARFLGEKAYVVTFKKIDPFFVIDLSDPTNPSILGSLKIPGYSDYLHPYDAEHIIGIGKDTVEAKEDETFWRNVDFAWYQGVKLAMFDVTDVSEPRELAKIIIGDRGTDSPALSDHKAFLFDKTKGLLVIPINLYEIDEELKDETGEYTGSLYGEFTFQGAYVYHVSLEDGFEYMGRITHLGIEDMRKSGFYPLYDASIVRTLYIEENLYTISNKMVKIHDLRDLTELASIQLL
ncbi:MAG: beta-propeller domain-containing protein, partial [Thermoplasmatota archaeon]